MDYADVARYIRALYDRMVDGQYALVTFEEVDYARLYAEPRMKGVRIMAVKSREEAYAHVPRAPGELSLWTCMELGANDVVDGVKRVEDFLLAPNDTYDRADRHRVVLARGPVEIIRTACGEYDAARVESLQV